MLAELKSFVYGTRVWHAVFKNRGELRHWELRKLSIVKWYRGEGSCLFPCPDAEAKINDFDEQTNALLTFIAVETKHASYLKDLCLKKESFRGARVADVGSGPFPTLLVFEGCERYCIDHLMESYRKMGYPISRFEPELRFIAAKSESIPVPDGYFDAVISRNALDHVDDFDATAREIRRILRPSGILHILVNYHRPTSTEPHVLNDEVIRGSFGSLGVRKVSEAADSWGFEGGKTVLWSNAPEAILTNTSETALVVAVQS
ncbi:MAG TPA: class I SAM-dependent methyltransferase [Verrucomicrobiae bacterium]